MLRFGVAPNEASLNLLMDTAARSGFHLDEAWDILEAGPGPRALGCWGARALAV